MLRPARMTRLVVVSDSGHLRAVVDELYGLRLAHLVEFVEGAEDLHEFRLGKPLPEGSQASERLVRLRGLSRQLGLVAEKQASARFRIDEVTTRLDVAIMQMETDITSVAEARGRIQRELVELQKRAERLRPLSSLPLSLEDYRGYESLAVVVGDCDAPFESALSLATEGNYELFSSEALHAVFVPKELLPAAQEALRNAGFRETEVPAGTGTPAEDLASTERHVQELQRRLDGVESELAKLRDRHAAFLRAAEEHLTIETEKADAPLSFASTEHAFVVEAWVPRQSVEDVRRALERATAGTVHIDAVGERTLHLEALDPHGHPLEPPTKYDNARPFKPFQFFTDLVSTPRYHEIDPTPVLALVLPLFLGFMIADVGYGALMILLGIMLIRKLRHLEGVRELGIGMALAGGVAAVFGGVIFQDAMGIPFFIPEMPHPEELQGAAFSCSWFMEHHKEATWSCIVAGQATVVPPILSKLRNVTDLLVISVLAAFVHMGLGLSFGIANSVGHSRKHAVAKVGWIFLMIAFFTQILFMAQANRIAGAIYAPIGALGLPIVELLGIEVHSVMLIGVILAAILLAYGEGPLAVLELPTMLSNLLSYTRLAGLAVAKGAMAAAFTSLTLVAMVYGGSGDALGIVLIVVGMILFVLTQLFVFVLGVFSSGIQAIRLNYVEFFNKFYTGGGKPFSPFGRKRAYTVETQVNP